MKIIPVLLVFLLFGFIGRAQNFFYIDNKNATEKSIRDQLMKASQYVTQSPLASDYIITATVEVQSGSPMLNLRMTMQDSVTYKTIFQSTEDYILRGVDANTRLFLKMTIAGFIEKNISQIIECARDDHFNRGNRFLKAAKDKI